MTEFEIVLLGGAGAVLGIYFIIISDLKWGGK